jgi:hypothetical protein
MRTRADREREDRICLFDTGELQYDPGMVTQRLAKEIALSEHNSILCRIDENGSISLSDLERKFLILREVRQETPDDLGHVSVGEQSAAAVSSLVACALPPRVAGTLAKAWGSPWKRAYMKVCLRLIGVKLQR